MLDHKSIENISLLSRKYHFLVNDETLWKLAFMEQFHGQREFSPVGSSPTWRSEYKERAETLQQFSCRRRGKHIRFDGRIGNITHMYYDEASKEAICANISTGLGSIILNSITGKVKKDLIYPSNDQLPSTDVTTMVAHKFGFLYGFANGQVASSARSKGTNRFNFNTLPGMHRGPVSALCTPDVLASSCVTTASGGSDGTVRLWNHRDPRKHCLAEIVISAESVISLSIDVKKHKLLGLTASGVFCVDFHDIEAVRFTTMIKINPVPKLSNIPLMVHDRRGSNLIVTTGTSIQRFAISEDLIMKTDFSYDMCRGRGISHLAIDPKEQNFDNRVLPGAGGRFLACADDSEILVFNCRSAKLVPISRVGWSYEPVSCLNISATVTAVGSIDGSVRTFDTLTGQALSLLNKRMTRHVRTTLDNTSFQVSCVFLDAQHASGIISIGGQVKFFDLDPPPDRRTGDKRKGSEWGTRDTHLVGNNRRALARQCIREDVLQLAVAKERAQVEQARLERLAGAGELTHSLNDAELLSYVTLLSQHASAEATEEAFEESLDVSVHPTGLAKAHASEHSGYDEYEMALAISLSRSIL